METKNPNHNPVVIPGNSRRPSEVVGNREIRPTSIQWVRLFALPTNPLEAMVVSLQWLWGSYASLSVSMVSPLAVQVVIGFIWLFLLGCLGILTVKDKTAQIDSIWVLLSITMGILLCL
jgi:hypothetical protein